MSHPTSEQYRLGVEIGRLVMAARDRGLSWDDAIATLRHSASLAEANRDLDLMTDDAARHAREAMGSI